MGILQYHLIEHTPKVGKYANQKVFSAKPINHGTISFDDLCKELADGSTVDKADIKAVLSRMATVIPRLTERGFSVVAGELGVFRASFGSKQVLSEAEFKTELISTPRIVFTPRKAFKDALRGVGFERSTKHPKRVKLDLKPREGGGSDSGGSGSTEGGGRTPEGGLPL